ncbi:hypothetical protein [Nocardia sp. NPDC004711]
MQWLHSLYQFANAHPVGVTFLGFAVTIFALLVTTVTQERRYSYDKEIERRKEQRAPIAAVLQELDDFNEPFSSSCGVNFAVLQNVDGLGQ